MATAELKNPMTGQNVNHAKTQYMLDRDPRELVFQFKKRTLVHFAVDPDLVFMTTQLKGKETYFLPFNMGLNRGRPIGPFGAGNPPNPNGHRTAYLWEEVWQRDSLLDIQAVQTLSRLNRTHPGKEDTFVLDFYNDRSEILAAFQTYYETTSVSDQADPHQFYALQAELDSSGVYHATEVQDFAKIFFKARAQNTPADHGAMNAILDKAVSRFVALCDDLKSQLPDKEWRQAQEKFRTRLQAFRNLYSFLSQVIPYQDTDLEKLYTYARFLLTKLPRPDAGPQYHFDDEVALKFYRLKKISEGAIALQSGVGGELKGPTAVGTGRGKDEEVGLSTLIELLNQRFGTDFRPADQLFLDSVREDAVADEELRQAALANTLDNFTYVFRRALEGLFIDRMEQNEDIFNRFMGDTQFQQAVEETLRRQVYDQIRGDSAPDARDGQTGA